jgi:hypothetical protein
MVTAASARRSRRADGQRRLRDIVSGAVSGPKPKRLSDFRQGAVFRWAIQDLNLKPTD